MFVFETASGWPSPCQSWPWTPDPPATISQVLDSTDVCHHAWSKSLPALPSALFETGSCVVYHSVCQAGGPPSIWRFSSLCLPSCTRAGVSNECYCVWLSVGSRDGNAGPACTIGTFPTELSPGSPYCFFFKKKNLCFYFYLRYFSKVPFKNVFPHKG